MKTNCRAEVAKQDLIADRSQIIETIVCFCANLLQPVGTLSCRLLCACLHLGVRAAESDCDDRECEYALHHGRALL